MRKLLFILFYFIGVLNTFSQSGYYGDGEIFELYDSTYKSEIDEFGFVNLFNINNKYANVEWARKDGKTISDEILLGYKETILDTPEEIDILKKLVAKHLNSLNSNGLLNGSGVTIILIINSTTGMIDGVNFSFMKNSPPCHISPLVYCDIEHDILNKSYQFPITNEGSKLNYCMIFWSHDF